MDTNEMREVLRQAMADWNSATDEQRDAALLRVSHCFRCGSHADMWFDGPGNIVTRRAICRRCEYADWRTTAAAFTSGQAH